MKSSNLGLVLLVAALLVSLIVTELPNLFAHAVIWLAAAACLAMVGVVVYVIYWFARNRISPVVRIEATVVRRRTKDWDITVTGETPEMTLARLGTMGRHPKRAAKTYNRLLASPDVPELEIAGGTEFFVTFHTGGREIEFPVSEVMYVKSEEGTRGLLAFQGEQFRHFIPLGDSPDTGEEFR